MKAYIKTKDSQFWVCDGGYGLSDDKSKATIFDSFRSARAYVRGTNIFGPLQIHALNNTWPKWETLLESQQQKHKEKLPKNYP